MPCLEILALLLYPVVILDEALVGDALLLVLGVYGRLLRLHPRHLPR
jgi:hypothetical protein